MSTGYHKIHKENCGKRPKEDNIIYLDDCICPIEAKNRAKEYFSNVSGCKYCCKEIFYKYEKGI